MFVRQSEFAWSKSSGFFFLPTYGVVLTKSWNLFFLFLYFFGFWDSWTDAWVGGGGCSWYAAKGPGWSQAQVSHRVSVSALSKSCLSLPPSIRHPWPQSHHKSSYLWFLCDGGKWQSRRKGEKIKNIRGAHWWKKMDGHQSFIVSLSPRDLVLFSLWLCRQMIWHAVRGLPFLPDTHKKQRILYFFIASRPPPGCSCNIYCNLKNKPTWEKNDLLEDRTPFGRGLRQFVTHLLLRYACKCVSVPERLSVYKTSSLFTGSMTHGCYGRSSDSNTAD